MSWVREGEQEDVTPETERRDQRRKKEYMVRIKGGNSRNNGVRIDA